MKKLIELIPMEPYFFGGERIFNGNENIYYSKSEQMMTQTSAFGCLRYLGIINRDSGYRLSDESIKQIGEKSYCFDSNKNFGKIRGISEVLLKHNDKYYAHIPYDYYLRVEKIDKKSFEPYHYANIKDQYEVIKSYDIFSSVNRIGIKKKSSNDDKEFYKKDYAVMEEGWSFVFACDVEDDFVFNNPGYVYMGTGKSIFQCNIIDAPEFDYSALVKDEKNSNENSFYCLSDIYLSEDGYTELGKISSRNHFGYKQHRTFTTVYGTQAKDRFKRGVGINLLSAGSVICNCDKEKLKELFDKDANDAAKMAGFNQIIDNKGEKLW